MTDARTSQTDKPVILCAEDERELLQDIAEELSEAGYTPIQSTNGELALKTLKTRRPDLILCDISMPVIGGFELLNAVRDMGPTYADIPFVFLTAFSDPKEVVRGKQLGADDYLVKPIDYDLLLATVHARLREVERIHDARQPHQSTTDADALATRFGLTPKEANVAAALADGLQPAQIADRFHVERTTIAFHMRNIFQKTGVGRQAELVSVLLRPDQASQ